MALNMEVCVNNNKTVKYNINLWQTAFFIDSIVMYPGNIKVFFK